MSRIAFLGVVGGFPNGNRTGFPFLCWMPHGMSHNPAAILGLRQVIRILDLFQPCPANIEGDIRVILGNVAQMICNGAANIQLRVVFEFFKQR